MSKVVGLPNNSYKPITNIDLCQDYVNEIALRKRKKKVIIENKFKNMYKKKGVNLGIK
jgi:hypothetical protein